MSFWYGMAQAKKDADARNHEKDMLELQHQQKLELQANQFAHQRAMAASRYRGGGGGGGRRGGGGGRGKSNKDAEMATFLMSSGMDPEVVGEIYGTGQLEFAYDKVKGAKEDSGFVASQFNDAVYEQNTTEENPLNVSVGNVLTSMKDVDLGTEEGQAEFSIRSKVTPEPVTNDSSVANDFSDLGEDPSFYDFSGVRDTGRTDTTPIINQMEETFSPIFEAQKDYDAQGNVFWSFDDPNQKMLFNRTVLDATNAVIDRWNGPNDYAKALLEVTNAAYDIYETDPELGTFRDRFNSWAKGTPSIPEPPSPEVPVVSTPSVEPMTTESPKPPIGVTTQDRPRVPSPESVPRIETDAPPILPQSPPGPSWTNTVAGETKETKTFIPMIDTNNPSAVQAALHRIAEGTGRVKGTDGTIYTKAKGPEGNFILVPLR